MALRLQTLKTPALNHMVFNKEALPSNPDLLPQRVGTDTFAEPAPLQVLGQALHLILLPYL